MPDQASTAVAQNLENIAGAIGDVLGDASIALTADQTTTLENAVASLTSCANQIANQSAMAALNAAQKDLDAITQATSSANAAAQKLKQQATRLNSLLALVGDALSLGAAIISGDLPGAIGDAAKVAADASGQGN